MFVSMIMLSMGCTVVHQLRDPATLPADGLAQKTRAEKALDYSIAVRVDAPANVVWEVLTDGPAFPSWNSTIVSLTGAIVRDGELELVSKVAPDRTFKLDVTTFDPPRHMVWEDGNAMFMGVRHFTVLETAEGTVVAMSETYSGGMLRMIEKSLPDFTNNFQTFARDLKVEAERRAGAVGR